MTKDNILDGLELITGPGAAQEEIEIPLDDQASAASGQSNASSLNDQNQNFENLIDLPEDHTKPGGAPIDDTQSSSPFSVLANEYIDRGLLPKDSEEFNEAIKNVKDWDSFFDVYKKFSQEDSLMDLNENQKEYLKALRNGVPVREYEQYQEASNYLNAITEQQLTDQKIVANIANVFYAVKGNDEDERKVLIQGALTKGPDNTKKMITFLKDYYKSQYDEAFRKYGDESKLNYDKQKVNVEKLTEFVKSKSLFEGVNLNDTTKQKVVELATKIVNPNENSPMNAVAKAIAEDPIAMQAKLAYVYLMTDGFKNLSGFSRKATSDSTKALQELINKPNLGSSFSSSEKIFSGNRTDSIVKGLEQLLK